MNKVKMKNGIGYSSKTGALYVDFAGIKSGAPVSPLNADQPARDIKQTIPFNIIQTPPWALWGDNNLLPNEMLEDIETCGILNAIIDAKSRFALCEGVVPALVRRNKQAEIEIVDIINDNEITDFLELNNTYYQLFAWMKDQCGFRNGVARFMLNKKKDKIATFQRDDVTEMRYELINELTGKIDNIFLSASWDRIGRTFTTDNQKYLRKINLLDFNNPIGDLTNKVSGGAGVEFAMTFRHPGWNKKYYSTPLWYAALKWVQIAQSIPDMKKAMFKNSIRTQYMVLIREGFWKKVFSTKVNGTSKSYSDYTEKEIEKKKNEVYDSIDENLTGTDNAFKAIFSEFEYSQDGKMLQDIEIKVLDNKLPQGEYLPESAVANSEIAFAEMFNPSIIGSNLPSGPYTNSQGGSNVREGILMQVILQEFERKQVQRILSVPKYFNGWAKTYQQKDAFLEFIIPATIPTTLDTGGSTKPSIKAPDNNSTPQPQPANGTN